MKCEKYFAIQIFANPYYLLFLKPLSLINNRSTRNVSKMTGTVKYKEKVFLINKNSACTKAEAVLKTQAKAKKHTGTCVLQVCTNIKHESSRVIGR